MVELLVSYRDIRAIDNVHRPGIPGRVNNRILHIPEVDDALPVDQVGRVDLLDEMGVRGPDKTEIVGIAGHRVVMEGVPARIDHEETLSVAVRNIIRQVISGASVHDNTEIPVPVCRVAIDRGVA